MQVTLSPAIALWCALAGLGCHALVNADLCGCAMHETCVQGVCEPTPCNHSGQCPDLTFCSDGLCAPGACSEDRHCPGGRCVEGYCYELECVDGERRACAGDCGEGKELCVDGVWRGCDAPGLVDGVCPLPACEEGAELPCSTDCGAGVERCAGGGWLACDAPAPSGQGACPGEAAVVAINDTTLVRLVEAEPGAALIGQRDDLIESLSAFDRSLLTRTEGAVSTEALLEHLSSTARDWTALEVERTTVAIELLAGWLNAYSLPLPSEISLAKVEAPGLSTHSRQTFVVLPQSALAAPATELAALLAHQLFHLLSREVPWLREALYAIIGYYACSPLAVPGELAELKITNLDAPALNHCVDLFHPDFERDYNYIPLTYASRPFSLSSGSGLSSYQLFRLQGVEVRAQESVVLLLSDELFQIDPTDAADPQAADYFALIGENTSAVHHPDEVLADNFVFLLRGDDSLPDPWVIERMAQVLAP